MSSEAWRAFAKGITLGIEEGSVNISYTLLRYYRRLKLSDTEMMLLLQLTGFRQMEQNAFPTIEELQERMGTSPEHVIKMLQKLMHEKFLTIDEEIDPQTGIQYERYNLIGVYEKLGACMMEDVKKERLLEQRHGKATTSAMNSNVEEETEQNLFSIFEREFGRPLSPMECETISGWLDQDQYPEELILLALKEAVFAGKVHFRYIDRILLEWMRNRVRTAEDARAYAQKFRGGRNN
ncbi:DNA replication protein DnaD [Paenibacillus selenitireducens]|uniref:DNA replication protein DnaD n=1 Tax=Paenibacillus selenitireducens TaxID=1324314 RepID=A0A1T2XNP1_9BACL|nr:DnaD domain-containing protein [Paenibacillus selenitireducens]OPA81487.1 DNA replication protein DnaD [Paenibacillus selenitireducens]